MLPGSTASQSSAELRSAKGESEPLVVFVVDSAGVVDPASFKMLRPGDARFVEAMTVALPGFRFSPGRLADGRRVRQLVQQPVVFALAR